MPGNIDAATRDYIRKNFARAFGDGEIVFLTDGDRNNVVTRVLDEHANVEVVATCKDAATARLIAELLELCKPGTRGARL
jgi:hypothetical protein